MLDVEYCQKIFNLQYSIFNIKNMKPQVGIIMGSDSDLSIMEEAKKVLDEFGIVSEMKILSAHRTPSLTAEYVSSAEKNGLKVIIAGAGMANHLAGAAAAHTILPVIGVPLDGSPLKGIDSLLSTVQMPGGVPVACVAIGKTGARNAGFLAAEILSLSDVKIKEKLIKHRQETKAAVIKKNENLGKGQK